MSNASRPTAAKRRLAIRIMQVLILAAIWLVLALWSLWAAGALLYDLPASWLRNMHQKFERLQSGTPYCHQRCALPMMSWWGRPKLC